MSLSTVAVLFKRVNIFKEDGSLAFGPMNGSELFTAIIDDVYYVQVDFTNGQVTKKITY